MTASAASPLSGRLLVSALVLFGLLTTTIIVVYWDQNTRPFRPLREAIGREFKRTKPQVAGGRHKGGPATLRIVMTVEFDPQADDAQAQKTYLRVVELARQQIDVTQYEVFELHLIHLPPQQQAVEREFEAKIAELPAAPAAA